MAVFLSDFTFDHVHLTIFLLRQVVMVNYWSLNRLSLFEWCSYLHISALFVVYKPWLWLMLPSAAMNHAERILTRVWRGCFEPASCHVQVSLPICRTGPRCDRKLCRHMKHAFIVHKIIRWCTAFLEELLITQLMKVSSPSMNSDHSLQCSQTLIKSKPLSDTSQCRK